MDRAEIKAPGLKWRNRAGGNIPYWVAKPAAVEAGYPLRTANLSSVPLDELPDRCAALEAEMLAWLSGPRERSFDGTLGSLISIYQTHEDSPYHALKYGSRHSYDHYLGRLISAYGDVRLDRLTGLDVKRWHKTWRGPDNRLGAAGMALAVLKSAISFGMVSGFPQCERLKLVMGELRLPSPKPRNLAPTAADVDKARAAAHAIGRHRAAFAYALQFETTIRQYDLTGQWVPMSDPRPSTVTFRNQKWLGPTWSAIDDNLVFTLMPSKTENTTRAKIHVRLSRCPMTMEELALIPEEARSGPLVINELTGRPYMRQPWEKSGGQSGSALGCRPRYGTETSVREE
jgi:hypothetical protein